MAKDDVYLILMLPIVVPVLLLATLVIFFWDYLIEGPYLLYKDIESGGFYLDDEKDHYWIIIQLFLPTMIYFFGFAYVVKGFL